MTTQKLTDLRGTPAFADALVERERALGLVTSTTSTASAASTAMSTTATPTDDAIAAGAVTPAESASEVDPHLERVDRWGNTILDAPGYLGQYRIERDLPWGERRILRVCGEAASDKHLLWWEFDDSERRMVCKLCWPETKGTAHV